MYQDGNEHSPFLYTGLMEMNRHCILFVSPRFDLSPREYESVSLPPISAISLANIIVPIVAPVRFYIYDFILPIDVPHSRFFLIG